MTEIVDDQMVSQLSGIFGIDPGRIVYGQLYTARRYWALHLSANPGVAGLPFMAFYRTIRFHDDRKASMGVAVRDADDQYKEATVLPVMLDYVVEVLTATVHEQSKLFKAYMLWAASGVSIGVSDALGTEFKLRVLPSDGEDNSDLESEDDQGRIIRSTFPISVESLLLEKELTDGPIISILAKVHGYYDPGDPGPLLGTVAINGG